MPLAGAFLPTNEKGNFFYPPKDSFDELKKHNNGVVFANFLKRNLNSRFFISKEGVTLCFDGVMFSNLSSDNLFSRYNKYGISFIKGLRGNYSGFILDEKKDVLHVFNDHLSTRNIYYFFNKEQGFYFANSLEEITQLLKDNKTPYSLDRDAVYMMSLYGFILEDRTYINEVKNLGYASILSYHIQENKLEINKWHDYSKIKKKRVKLDEATHTINSLFEKAVINCWEEDQSKNHLALLSGGLDSKSNVIVARKLGFSGINTITFGQENSKDVKYARLVAKKEEFNHYERFLDSPFYLLKNIEENYIKPTDGMMMFHSSAHTSSTLRDFNLNGFTNLHTGQIGDVLFGSFSNPNFNFKAQKDKIGYTGFVKEKEILSKISSLDSVLDKYQELGIELYTYEQRQINATIYGDRSLSNLIDNLSPFYDLELINFCLSLPDEMKKDQKIYFDWLNEYHKEVLQYPWDKINMKPNTFFKMKYGKTLKKYVNGGKKYFKLKYESMNPYQIWLDNNPTFIEKLDKILLENLENPIIDRELKEDLLKVYTNNIFEYRNKFAVVTAVLAIKLYF